MLASTCGSGDDEGSQRSTDAFCAELSAGLAELQVGTGNVSEYDKLLRNLDQTAPTEIQAEMSASVGAWDSLKDSLGEAVSNPRSAGVLAAITALSNASSVRAVNEYAQSNCGESVFGFTGFDSASPP